MEFLVLVHFRDIVLISCGFFDRVKSERKVGWWKGCPDGCVEGMNVGEDAYMDG